MPDEEECVKNWKLYDDLFHYVFYNTSTKKIIIKKKVKKPLVIVEEDNEV